MNEQTHDNGTSPSRDWVGWIALAWVLTCSIAYFHMAVVPRFPWLYGAQ